MNYTIETLKTKTLSQVSDLYRDGAITRELAEEYVTLWNAGPHFTTAIVTSRQIVNRDNDSN